MGSTFSEADRVQVRKWLGFSGLYLEADPRLENALSNIQMIGDGAGTKVDDSTVLAVKDYLTKLTGIEAQWVQLTAEGGMQGGTIDELKIDPLRGLEGLKKIARMYVGFICDCLSTRPRRDVFSSPKLLGVGDASIADYSDGKPQW